MPIFKIIAIFGPETWEVAKVPVVVHISSFYPKGSKLSSILLYGQRFPWYGAIFKIAIFGHETGPSAKVPEVAHIAVFYPRGAQSGLFSDFQHCHIWPCNFAIGKSSRSCTFTLLLPHGVTIKLIFALRTAALEIRDIFQNFHIWAWNLEFEDRSHSWICTLFLPQGVEIKLIFFSTGSHFRDRAILRLNWSN